MVDIDRPTPERLPRPFEELSRAELEELFPDRKPYYGEKLGDSDLGAVIEVSEGYLEALQALEGQAKAE